VPARAVGVRPRAGTYRCLGGSVLVNGGNGADATVTYHGGSQVAVNGADATAHPA
jgi:hypothetical protein